VAIVTRTREAQDDYGRTLGPGFPRSPSHDSLTPDERSTLALIEEASPPAPTPASALWGGFAAARQTALRLCERLV